jgi:hypothetical protein
VELGLPMDAAALEAASSKQELAIEVQKAGHRRRVVDDEVRAGHGARRHHGLTVAGVAGGVSGT